jgi:hypothetical protein
VLLLEQQFPAPGFAGDLDQFHCQGFLQPQPELLPVRIGVDHENGLFFHAGFLWVMPICLLEAATSG